MTTFESSVVVRWVRDAARAGARALTQRIAPGATTETEAYRIARESRLLTAIESMFSVIGAAWQDTLATGLLSRPAGELRALEPWERVRLFGWVLFVAAMLTGLWRAQDGLVSRPVLLSALMMVVAAVVMKQSPVIAAAWTDRFTEDPHHSAAP